MREYNGRQKMKMVKIASESNLKVTFSKRRSGVFKKASELCTLCGAEVAIVVFSPSKTVFSFGHPCVESVVDRLVNKNPPPTSDAMEFFKAYNNANIQELNMELTQEFNELEVQKKRAKELKNMRKAFQSQCWWGAPIEELNRPQLEQMKELLEELKKNVIKKAENLLIQSSVPPQFFPGCSSTGGGVLPFDPNNIGFNPNLPNMMHHTPPDMIPHAPPSLAHPQGEYNLASLAHHHEEYNPASLAHPLEKYNPEFGGGFH